MSVSETNNPETEQKRPPASVRLAEIDEIDVRIEQLVSGGDGLARFEGIPIFVPMSVPGDHLKVRLVQRKPHFGRAVIVEILDRPALFLHYLQRRLDLNALRSVDARDELDYLMH